MLLYRPFIDGLRAISISAVVGFHVGLPGFAAKVIVREHHFEEFGTLLSQTISHLLRISGRRILLIGEIPGAPSEVPDCLIRADRKH
jgi:hypothetical protein